jgi:hypothetical protein
MATNQEQALAIVDHIRELGMNRSMGESIAMAQVYATLAVADELRLVNDALGDVVSGNGLERGLNVFIVE